MSIETTLGLGKHKETHCPIPLQYIRMRAILTMEDRSHSKHTQLVPPSLPAYVVYGSLAKWIDNLQFIDV